MEPTLLVLAAGMGSRYGGIKQIDAVGLHNECLLDYATFDAFRSGYGKVVYVIRKEIEADFRERFFDRVARNGNAEYVFQDPAALFTAEEAALKNPERTKPWGTMHAVLCGEKAVNTPFTVINADDYYGRSAFEVMAAHLSQLAPDATEHAIVGYVLENTMSRVGSVSRGICDVKDGYLTGITENTKIYYAPASGAESGAASGADSAVNAGKSGQGGGDRILSDIPATDAGSAGAGSASTGNGARTDGDGGTISVELTGKEWVSMNFMGFAPSAFKTFHEYWDEFVSKSVSSLKDEAYLPTGATRIIQSGAGKMKFFTSTEKWFGMTYQEDRELVRAAIAQKIADGYYPERLWEK